MRAIEAFIVFAGLGLLVGLLTGRLIALLVVPAAVVTLVGLGDSVLPGDLHWWIVIVEGAFAALGIAVGVGARRIVQRDTSRR